MGKHGEESVSQHTAVDGIGEDVPGHEVGLWRAGHARQHLALAHRVLAGRQLDDLCACSMHVPSQIRQCMCIVHTCSFA